MAAVKSNAPWSVKGIERDARETAKEAAQREGMTVGAWLNQMIYNAGAPESSGGVVEGLRLKDVITAIEALNTRVATAEGKSAEAVDKLARNFGGVVERVQRLERGGGDAAVGERLKRLEEKSEDRQRIDTLKALEKAVGQVALQFNTAHKESVARLDAQEKHLQQLAGRLEGAESDPQAASAINYLKNAIDGLGARISRAERIASEATKLNKEATETVDAQFVERTGARLRVLGDEIKRGGDQMRSLETSIVKLSSQIDAAEKRSAEGVHKVSETIVELRQQFSSIEAPEAGDREELEAAVEAVAQRTEERISSLQQSFDDMISRLEQSELDEEELTEELTTTHAIDIAEEEVSESEALSVFDLDDDLETNDAGDEFSVDLDDLSPSASTEETDDILSQVREAYGEEGVYETSAEPEEDTPPANTEVSDLDAVLAELEGLGLREDQPQAADQTVEEDQPQAVESETDAFLGDLNEPQSDETLTSLEETPAPAADDFLKTARPSIKDASETPEARKTKRQLTPKQRAILAARVKRKRQETASQQISDTPAAKKTKAQLAAQRMALADSQKLAPDVIDYDESDEEETSPSIMSKIGSAFGSLRARLPGGDKSSEDEDATLIEETLDNNETEDTSEDDDPNLTSAAKKALGGFSSKPITIALAASIILAIVALFFIVKDVFLSPPASAPEARIPVTTNPAAISAPEPTATQEPTLAEVPEAPTIQPRDLYLESVAALQLAKTPDEEAAAIQKMQEAAALGHPPAQLQLGEFYKTGQGFDQDLTQARIWYERAATGGNVLAMHRAGVMTAQGEGGPADMNAAIEWFEKAGNRALVDSQYNLGAIYHPGADGAEGVQNAGQAYYWYSLASKNGDDQAASLAAGLSGSIDSNLKSELDASVSSWAPTPANPVANEVSPAS